MALQSYNKALAMFEKILDKSDESMASPHYIPACVHQPRAQNETEACFSLILARKPRYW